MTVIYYNIIPPETMQLELISWRDKAEVFYHQLVFDFFFSLVEVPANPVWGASCPAQVMLWVSTGRTGRHCGPYSATAKVVPASYLMPVS